MQDGKLLNANDVCRQLGICYAHLRRLINNREIAYINIGACTRVSYRFSQKDVDEFIDRKKVWNLNNPEAPLVGLTMPSQCINKAQYEMIDFVAQRAARNIPKPKGGWHKRKKIQDK